MQHIQQDVCNTLGEIQPESDGLLSFNDFCRIYGLVQRYSHSSLYPQLRRLIDDRRRALRRQDEATYKEIQSEILEMEEQIVREVSDEIYANLDITADVWQSSWQRVQESPGNAEDFSALQHKI